MSAARLPIRIPEEIAAIAGDAPAGLLSESFREASERFDRYVGAVAIETAGVLEVPVDVTLKIDTLIAQRGWSPGGALALRWLLETLATYGHGVPVDGGWRLARPARAVETAASIREQAVAAVPHAAPAYRVFDLCAAALGGVLRGEARGEEALFSPATLGLWFEYFSNDNPHYALNNTLAATALARAVAPGAHVLEVGGGGGSAALATLAALAAAARPPRAYTFTELHPAFLRRGSRAVHAAAPAGCAVTALRYDFESDPSAQTLGAHDVDAILAVNVLHLGSDLVGALARLRGLLRPGGVLVLGELLRENETAGVHIELPFTLLEAYRRTPAIDGVRARPGFLSATGWRRALLAAGFREVSVLPREFARCVALYPGFYCGAITAAS